MGHALVGEGRDDSWEIFVCTTQLGWGDCSFYLWHWTRLKGMCTLSKQMGQLAVRIFIEGFVAVLVDKSTYENAE